MNKLNQKKMTAYLCEEYNLENYDLTWMIESPKFGGFMNDVVDVNVNRPGHPLEAKTVLFTENFRESIENIMKTVDIIYPYQAYIERNTNRDTGEIRQLLVFRYDATSESEALDYRNLEVSFV